MPARLLLVENDLRLGELLGAYLARRGFEVRRATSFAEARRLLGEGRPDLMLSDVDLGGENARDELPRLAAEGLLPPTLVVGLFGMNTGGLPFSASPYGFLFALACAGASSAAIYFMLQRLRR